MRRWHYGANSYHKTAHVCCDEAPRYVFWIYDVVEMLCDWAQDLLYIRLLPIKVRIKEGWNDKPATVRLDKWFGTIADLIHCYMHMPVFEWCHNKKFKSYCIEVGFKKLKKAFYEADKNFWDGEQATTDEMLKDEEE